MSSEDVYLVNVHVPFEGEITGTDVHIPYTDLADRLAELPAEGTQTLVLYCRSGNMSTAAAQDLVAAVRTGFLELDGGFIAWNEAGLPFEP
jgi:rhodanese-related sulfurtransferase